MAILTGRSIQKNTAMRLDIAQEAAETQECRGSREKQTKCDKVLIKRSKT